MPRRRWQRRQRTLVFGLRSLLLCACVRAKALAATPPPPDTHVRLLVSRTYRCWLQLLRKWRRWWCLDADGDEHAASAAAPAYYIFRRLATDRDVVLQKAYTLHPRINDYSSETIQLRRQRRRRRRRPGIDVLSMGEEAYATTHSKHRRSFYQYTRPRSSTSFYTTL